MSDLTTADDRCRGVLIGLAAGDCIGGPIRMALRLAESLVETGGFDPADVVGRYLAWWREGAFAGPSNYCPALVGAVAGARWGASAVPSPALAHVEILPRVRAAADALAAGWVENAR